MRGNACREIYFNPDEAPLQLRLTTSDASAASCGAKMWTGPSGHCHVRRLMSLPEIRRVAANVLLKRLSETWTV